MNRRLVVIALGANLGTRAGGPLQTLEAAVCALASSGLCVVRRSRWYVSAPTPPSAQPRYMNGAIAVVTPLSPLALLRILKRTEKRFGRERANANAARVLDLDLVDMRGMIVNSGGAHPLRLPHPRMASRLFVLNPLRDVAGAWRHPETGQSVKEMIARLPSSERLAAVPRAKSHIALAKSRRRP